MIAETLKWTPERVEMLRELVARGDSAGQIGRSMGISRNAAVGKVMRLGLKLGGATKTAQSLQSMPGRAASGVVPEAQRRASALVRAKARPANIVVATRATPELAAARVDAYLATPARQRAFDPAQAPAGARLVALTDLNRGECKWPLFEDGPMVFCGCAADDGQNYCPTHRRMARGLA